MIRMPSALWSWRMRRWSAWEMELWPRRRRWPRTNWKSREIWNWLSSWHLSCRRCNYYICNLQINICLSKNMMVFGLELGKKKIYKLEGLSIWIWCHSLLSLFRVIIGSGEISFNWSIKLLRMNLVIRIIHKTITTRRKNGHFRFVAG